MNGPLIIDLAGTMLSEQDKQRLLHPVVGGVILFSRNITSLAQMTDLIAQIREVAPFILISVDQEGGRVQRFKDGFTELPPMRYLGQRYEQDAASAIESATQLGWLMAAEVKAAGVDLSYAPVLDLDLGQNEVIGDRAFHHDPLVVTRLATAFIVGMQSAGMACVGKHFPGHGHVRADSHLALPADDREFNAILQDAGTFHAVSHLLTAIMPAHILCQSVDNVPVTFSDKWLQSILREQLQYLGLIISDDLSMAGAKFYPNINQSFEFAMRAGCDFCLLCNNTEAVDSVLNMHSEGEWIASRADKVRLLRGDQSPWLLEQLKKTDKWKKAQSALSDLKLAVAA